MRVNPGIASIVVVENSVGQQQCLFFFSFCSEPTNPYGHTHPNLSFFFRCSDKVADCGGGFPKPVKRARKKLVGFLLFDNNRLHPSFAAAKNCQSGWLRKKE